MGFDFAAAKMRVRKLVHATLSISALYESKHLAAPEPLQIRWHNKLTDNGDMESQGYPVSIDTIDKVVFDRVDLEQRGIVISKGGLLTITAKGFNGQRLHIDMRDPTCGPTEEIWRVSKASYGPKPP